MRYFILASVLLMPLVAFAVDPPTQAGGLTIEAKEEIARRRGKVEDLGSVQATADSIAIDALKPPEHDDNKFHFTIVTSPESKWVPACDKFLRDWNTDEDLRAWGKPDEPATSWSLMQSRSIANVTQEWWFAKIKEKLQPTKDGKPIVPIDKDGRELLLFPALVIQPPLNGKVGAKQQIVAIFQGYDISPNRYAEMIGIAIDRWNLTQARIGGHAQSSGSGKNPPPFPVPGKVDPFEPTSIVTHPAHLTPRPKVLTPKQIKELIPDAPRDFRADLAERELSDPAEVRLAWLSHREDELKKKQAESEKKKSEASPPVQQVEVVQIEPRHAEPPQTDGQQPYYSDGQPPNFRLASAEAPAIDLMPYLLVILLLVGMVPAWLPLIQKWRSGTNELKNGTKPNT